MFTKVNIYVCKQLQFFIEQIERNVSRSGATYIFVMYFWRNHKINYFLCNLPNYHFGNGFRCKHKRKRRNLGLSLQPFFRALHSRKY